MRNECGGAHNGEAPQMHKDFNGLPLGKGAAKPGIECFGETYFCTGGIKSDET